MNFEQRCHFFVNLTCDFVSKILTQTQYHRYRLKHKIDRKIILAQISLRLGADYYLSLQGGDGKDLSSDALSRKW